MTKWHKTWLMRLLMKCLHRQALEIHGDETAATNTHLMTYRRRCYRDRCLQLSLWQHMRRNAIRVTAEYTTHFQCVAALNELGHCRLLVQDCFKVHLVFRTESSNVFTTWSDETCTKPPRDQEWCKGEKKALLRRPSHDKQEHRQRWCWQGTTHKLLEMIGIIQQQVLCFSSGFHSRRGYSYKCTLVLKLKSQSRYDGITFFMAKASDASSNAKFAYRRHEKSRTSDAKKSQARGDVAAWCHKLPKLETSLWHHNIKS